MKPFLRHSIYLAVASALGGTTVSAWADTPLPTLGTVTVKARPEGALQTPASGAEQGETISGSALKILGGPGQTNPYQAISLLPSVLAQNPDPYGFANVPGGNKGIRIRGERNPHGGIGTVEGLPLSAINPGPGEQFLFDMEDIRSVTLLRPPFAPNNLSVFTTQGYLNSEVLWPQAQFGGVVSQSFGSFDFHRTFIRMDSGALPTGTRFFVSGSYTHAGQWRGPGGSPDFRYNGEIGISQDFSPTLTAKLYAAYDNMKENNYLPLSYAQASDPGKYYNLGYNANLTGNAAQDVNYYGYNRQKFQDYAIFGELNWHPNAQSTFVLKPFYSQENGYYLMGKNAIGGDQPGLLHWGINHHSYGLVAQYHGSFSGTQVTMGYWFENLNPPGPPTSWKIYRIDPAGGLTFGGWALLARATANHVFNSPYFTVSHDFGALRVTGGARYLMEQTPSFTVYNTQGIGDVSYDAALAQATSVNPIRSASGHTFYQWLPYFGMVYDATPHMQATFAYGRDNGAPAFNNWPQLQMNWPAFQKAGMTVQSGWDTVKPETSNAFNLGLNIHYDRWYLRPALFFATYRNKYVTFYDPRVGISYDQNAGTGHAWGAELSAGVNPLPDLTVFSNLAYDRANFTQNIRTLGGTILPVKGLQFPDTPLFVGSLGASYRYHRFSVSPNVQYLTSRYVDSMHTEVVPGYFLANLNFGYKQHLAGIGTLNANLVIMNLFNRHYIGLIDTSYLQSSGASFFPGAPITVAGTVSLQF
ncbi:MAG: TonB-dependent receptor [Gammaproteobacteria bacterium]|nr:TonB-dependent receptor [Gammaproteobacteria bacterium]